jgi:uncharacterized phage protein (TIGR01671 family)
MMREIKFRAFNTIVSRMQYFNLQDIEKQKGSIQWHILKIMQYTGLKDREGKEIYEGDIVKFKHNVYDSIEGKNFIETLIFKQPVIYDKEKAQFTFKYQERYKIKLKYTEIIGNIYDNPELLKEEV